jgi:hypothetical protein
MNACYNQTETPPAREHGMNEHIVALVAGFTIWPGSILASRALFGALCPELMKKADENAQRRIQKEDKRENR